MLTEFLWVIFLFLLEFWNEKIQQLCMPKVIYIVSFEFLFCFVVSADTVSVTDR